jgi:hypothetical protein
MRLDNLVGRTIPLSAIEKGGEFLAQVLADGDRIRGRGPGRGVPGAVPLGVGTRGVADAARHPSNPDAEGRLS